MSWERRSRLRVEELESRIVPSISRSVGTFQITDTSVTPNRTRGSESKGRNSWVPESDTLVGKNGKEVLKQGKEMVKLGITLGSPR
jgi:hypothetical protein